MIKNGIPKILPIMNSTRNYIDIVQDLNITLPDEQFRIDTSTLTNLEFIHQP